MKIFTNTLSGAISWGAESAVALAFSCKGPQLYVSDNNNIVGILILWRLQNASCTVPR